VREIAAGYANWHWRSTKVIGNAWGWCLCFLQYRYSDTGWHENDIQRTTPLIRGGCILSQMKGGRW